MELFQKARIQTRMQQMFIKKNPCNLSGCHRMTVLFNPLRFSDAITTETVAHPETIKGIFSM